MSLLVAGFAAGFAAHSCVAAAIEPRLVACAATAAAAGSPRRATVARAAAAGIVMLNRVLLEPSECSVEADGQLVAQLAPSDPRAEHMRSHVKAEDGKLLRAGVLDAGATNSAKLKWVHEHDEVEVADTATKKKAAAAAMRLELGAAVHMLRPIGEDERPRLDLLLAMPRPAGFARLVPMLSSLGIGKLWLTGAARVEKRYFSSHLLKEGNEALIREQLVAGLEQSGDTAVPRFEYVREVRHLLGGGRLDGGGESESGAALPPLVKLACHPERVEGPEAEAAALDPRLRVRRLGDIEVPPGARLLLAIGPERGWEEPDELELLVSHGFQLVTLGPRTLRTDVACIGAIAVAHEILARADAAAS